MKLVLPFPLSTLLLGQTKDSGPLYPKRVFSQGETTVTVIGDGSRFEAILSPVTADADTALVQLFYYYEAQIPELKRADGKPTKLMIHTQAICPVLGSTGSVCDITPREGFSVESIEFVRVTFLKTIKEVDHIKPVPE